jgi:hypothetical protein
VQALLQARDERVVGTLLWSEDARRILECRLDVAEHHQPCRAQPAAVADRLDRAGAAVGGRAAADGDEDLARAARGGGQDQLARTARRGAPRIALGGGEQREAGRLRHLDDGGRGAVDEAEVAVDGAPAWIGGARRHELTAACLDEQRHRPLAAVGDGAEVGLPAGLVEPGGERARHGRRVEGALEGVGRDEGARAHGRER